MHPDLSDQQSSWASRAFCGFGEGKADQLQPACSKEEQQEANMMRSIVDTLRGHRSDSQGAPGNVLLPIDSSGVSSLSIC